MNFLDSGPFGKLLTAVDHGILPSHVLSQTLLSPVTALESAQHTPKLRIMHEHRENLRPVRSRYLRNPETFEIFLGTLAVESPDYYRRMLNAAHTECVMHPPFLAFHKSRYGKNPPTTISGSKRFTSDVRDSMQLIISQEIPFITSDLDLRKKLSPSLQCQVIHADLDLNCILGAMQIANLGWLTGDRVGR